MNMRDLIPWSRGGGTSQGQSTFQAPSVFQNEGESPFLALHREMNRLFDDAFRSFDAPTLFGRMPTWPSLEVSETDKEVRVAAELPGLEENDVEVLLEDGGLTIRGEKKAESEDKERHFSERFYGRFERRIPLGFEAEEEKVSAAFKNGVLTVTVPKTAEAQKSMRRVPINGRTH
jgi:HSP20 family protein